jgi:hypothetical protein
MVHQPRLGIISMTNVGLVMALTRSVRYSMRPLAPPRTLSPFHLFLFSDACSVKSVMNPVVGVAVRRRAPARTTNQGLSQHVILELVH